MHNKIDLPAYTPEDAAPIIEEFSYAVELADRTRLKYVNCVAEFALWLDGLPLLEVKRRDVHDFMIYLRSGRRAGSVRGSV